MAAQLWSLQKHSLTVSMSDQASFLLEVVEINQKVQFQIETFQ